MRLPAPPPEDPASSVLHGGLRSGAEPDTRARADVDGPGAMEGRGAVGAWSGADGPVGGSAGGEACVLVVDDDDSVRTSVAQILRAAGYQVREAGDGAAAVARMTEDQVGVVVLDMRMPRGGGLEVLRSAGSGSPPVVLVSGYPLAGDAGLRQDPHVFTVLQKPFKPRALLDAVAGALGRGLEG